MVAPAHFIGRQSGCGFAPDIDLYNLDRDIPGHPAGSTVSADTLRAAGYVVGQPPAALPTVNDVPAAPLALLEVVPHPQGGWCIARPVDASRSTTRFFSVRYSTRAIAQAKLDAEL
jgi:hypothetical protein